MGKEKPLPPLMHHRIQTQGIPYFQSFFHAFVEYPVIITDTMSPLERETHQIRAEASDSMSTLGINFHTADTALDKPSKRIMAQTQERLHHTLDALHNLTTLSDNETVHPSLRLGAMIGSYNLIFEKLGPDIAQLSRGGLNEESFGRLLLLLSLDSCPALLYKLPLVKTYPNGETNTQYASTANYLGIEQMHGAPATSSYENLVYIAKACTYADKTGSSFQSVSAENLDKFEFGNTLNYSLALLGQGISEILDTDAEVYKRIIRENRRSDVAHIRLAAEQALALKQKITTNAPIIADSLFDRTNPEHYWIVKTLEEIEVLSREYPDLYGQALQIMGLNDIDGSLHDAYTFYRRCQSITSNPNYQYKAVFNGIMKYIRGNVRDIHGEFPRLKYLRGLPSMSIESADTASLPYWQNIRDASKRVRSLIKGSPVYQINLKGQQGIQNVTIHFGHHPTIFELDLNLRTDPITDHTINVKIQIDSKKAGNENFDWSILEDPNSTDSMTKYVRTQILSHVLPLLETFDTVLTKAANDTSKPVKLNGTPARKDGVKHDDPAYAKPPAPDMNTPEPVPVTLSPEPKPAPRRHKIIIGNKNLDELIPNLDRLSNDELHEAMITLVKPYRRKQVKDEHIGEIIRDLIDFHRRGVGDFRFIIGKDMEFDAALRSARRFRIVLINSPDKPDAYELFALGKRSRRNSGTYID